MKNDGKCWIWIPSDISLSRLEQSGADRINAIHTALGKPLVTVGGANPYKSLLTDIADTAADGERDVEAWTINDTPTPMSVWGPVENVKYIKVADVQLIVACGGDVEGLPVWYELTNTNTDCPFSTEEPKENWWYWGRPGGSNLSHKPVQYGTKWYRSNAVGQSGTLQHASEWVPYLAQLTVKTLSEFLAIQAANSTPL